MNDARCYRSSEAAPQTDEVAAVEAETSTGKCASDFAGSPGKRKTSITVRRSARPMSSTSRRAPRSRRPPPSEGLHLSPLAADWEDMAARLAMLAPRLIALVVIWLLAAASCDGLAAAVPFYGILSHRHGLLAGGAALDPAKKPREPLAVARELRCPLLAIFGDRDEFVPLPDVRALEAELARAPQRSEVRVYPGCGHAFLNDTRPQAFRAFRLSSAAFRPL